jgi:hypothetical protein
MGDDECPVQRRRTLSQRRRTLSQRRRTSSQLRCHRTHRSSSAAAGRRSSGAAAPPGSGATAALHDLAPASASSQEIGGWDPGKAVVPVMGWCVGLLFVCGVPLILPCPSR